MDKIIINTSRVIKPTKIGAIKPDTDPIIFEIPKRVPAYLGAISIWFTKKPEYWDPLKATPQVRRTIARTCVRQSVKATPIRQSADPIPPIKIYRVD